MGPKVKTVQPKSQATPLSNDVLQQLRGQISEGAFGQGAGPLQRQAGTAIQQYLGSIQNRAIQPYNPVQSNTAVPATNDLNQLISAVQQGSQTQTNRQAANLREAYGIAGTRFGTSLGTGEARLRSDAQNNLDQLIGNLRMNAAAQEQQARQFDVGANIGENQFGANFGLNQQNLIDQNTLAAISQLYGQGQGNVSPFLQLAQLGIIPQQVLASPGVGAQLLSAAGQAGAAYLSGGTSMALPGGGGSASSQILSPQFNAPSFYSAPGTPSGLGLSNVNPQLFQ